MEYLLNTEAERCRMEIYSEYLKKIPQLLQQLQTVETMHEKARMEEAMLPKGDTPDRSTQLYAQRLASTRQQCRTRAADIREQLRLIFELKAKIEAESTALASFIGK